MQRVRALIGEADCSDSMIMCRMADFNIGERMPAMCTASVICASKIEGLIPEPGSIT